MEIIISLRAFSESNPTHTETWGLLGETDHGEWNHNRNSAPDTFSSAFDRYVADEIDDIDAVKPAPQRIYDGVVVILDELVFRVADDGIECEYRISNGRDLADGQTICSDRNDSKFGGTAERRYSDERIADAVQRTADALDHRIDWLDVISPRSLAPLADAVEDLLEGDDAE
jgi:hypothetical protein